MVSQAEIITKYNEFYKAYSNKHIDDYEVFVRTRVIEYFFHLSHNSIDVLTSFVNKVLDEEEIDSSMFSQQKSIATKDKREDTLLSAQSTDIAYDDIPTKNLISFFVSSVVIAGLLSFIFPRKK
jgi:hypothetical protein